MSNEQTESIMAGLVSITVFIVAGWILVTYIKQQNKKP
jgi:hypothetical protein